MGPSHELERAVNTCCSVIRPTPGPRMRGDLANYVVSLPAAHLPLDSTMGSPRHGWTVHPRLERKCGKRCSRLWFLRGMLRLLRHCTEQGYRRGFTFGSFFCFCSGSGLRKRVTPLFLYRLKASYYDVHVCVLRDNAAI